MKGSVTQTNRPSHDQDPDSRSKSAFDLIALALAGAVTVLTAGAPFSLYDVMIGAVLLIVLSTRDTAAMPLRAYCAVWALLWVVILRLPIDFVLLAVSQTELRSGLDWLGHQLREVGFLPNVNPSENRDWLAAYQLIFTSLGFLIWYCLAALMSKKRDPRLRALLWWRAQTPK